MTLGATSGTDGNGERRPPESEQPRDSELRAALAGVWSAAGADPEDVQTYEYGYTHAPDKAPCADLDPEDRWFGERAGSAQLLGRDQRMIEEAIVGHLEAEGFTVRRYRSSHPQSMARAFAGVRDELVVYGFPNDGFVDVTARAGPCAPAFTSFDPDLYVPEG